MCMCICVYVRARACVRVRVRACACVCVWCVWGYACTCACRLCDNGGSVGEPIGNSAIRDFNSAGVDPTAANAGTADPNVDLLPKKKDDAPPQVSQKKIKFKIKGAEKKTPTKAVGVVCDAHYRDAHLHRRRTR